MVVTPESALTHPAASATLPSTHQSACSTPRAHALALALGSAGSTTCGSTRSDTALRRSLLPAARSPALGRGSSHIGDPPRATHSTNPQVTSKGSCDRLQSIT
jgi:hypothetical protein